MNGTSISMQRVCTLGRSVVAWGRQDNASCTRIRDTMAPWAGATISQAVSDSRNLHMSRPLTCDAPLLYSLLRVIVIQASSGAAGAFTMEYC